MAKGDDVWFDKVSLAPGVDWDKERDRGQREAELVVHLCSATILKRAGVVNREIRQTLRLVEDQPLGALYVIPIRLEPIKMPVELTRFQYFDFGDDWKERLSEGIARRRAQLADNSPQLSKQIVTEKNPSKGSQKIEFEDIANSYECRGQYIRYDEKGLYWTYVNGAIASHSLEEFYSAKSAFGRLLAQQSGVEGEDGLKSEWSISAEEFFRSGDMISLRFYTYIGYARAAHPSHYIRTLNFFGEDGGPIDIHQLLGHSIDSAQKIIAYCEKVIAAQFDEGELGEGSFFENYKKNEEDAWKLLAQFGFDRRGLTFNFSPYDVLPYVFGSHEVQVPWRFLGDMISDEYKSVVEKVTEA